MGFRIPYPRVDSDANGVYMHFLIFGREISARTSHGFPKLCGYPVQRRVGDISTHVWVRYASYVMHIVRVLCAVYHARAVHVISPGFLLRQAFTLNMTYFLKR